MEGDEDTLKWSTDGTFHGSRKTELGMRVNVKQ